MKPLSRMRPADSITILFLLCLVAVTLAFHARIPRLGMLMFTYSALLLLQIIIVGGRGSSRENGFMDMFRSIVFPIFCVLVIFDSLELLVHQINPHDIDPLLMRLDYLIFNGHPTVMLERFQNPLMTDVLQMAYTSYYFLPVSLGVILKLRGKDGEFERTVFLILLCFYLSYAGYMLFPALGPRFAMNHLQSFELKGAFIAGPLQAVLNRLEGVKRDAFPSGHTAVALVVLGLAYRFQKRFFYAALPVVLLLIFSTVYCRYHYVVDVIGGVILAAITFMIGDRYYGYWEVRNGINH